MLQCYYDSSNKSDPDDGKAQYGTALHLHDGPIMWSSRKHRNTGLSSTANEYMALKHAVVDTVHMRMLLDEIGIKQTAPTPCMGDNDQATTLARESRVTLGNRMIFQDYHWTKEMFELGHITTHRIDTTNNHTDPLTKPLARQHCERLVPILTGTGNGLPPIPTKVGVYGN